MLAPILVCAPILLGAGGLGGALSIRGAIDLAVAAHPALREAIAREEEAARVVGVRRTAYLPALELSAAGQAAGLTLAPGVFLDLPGIPTVSGAPVARAFAPGSTAGAAFDWNADLLHAIALTDAAIASSEEATEARRAAALTVAADAGDAFLALAEAGERVRAEKMNVDRAKVFLKVVAALVMESLRPAADGSRAQAILALTQVDLARAQAAVKIARARLGVALGEPGTQVPIDAEGLGRLPEHPLALSAPSSRNPFVLERTRAVRVGRLDERAINLELLPRIDLLAAAWARGTGFGSPVTPGDGVWPAAPSWAAGIALLWPAFSIFEIRARARAAAARVEAFREDQRRVFQAVQGEVQSARAALEGTLAVARRTPVALGAARITEMQALARYQAGLVTVEDVAEAEAILARAEVEDAVARLEVRRAELTLARAAGDLSPFLAEVAGG